MNPTSQARSGFLLAHHAPNPTAEQERELAQRVQSGCRRSADALVRSHIRLVYSVAREYSTFGSPMDDLVAEGALGLCVAVTRFDVSRNVRFGVYALWWIRAYVRRHTIVNRRITKPPLTRSFRRMLARVRKTEHALTHKHGEPPDALTVADALGVTLEELNEFMAVMSAHDVACSSENDWRAVSMQATTAPSVEAALVDAQLAAQRRARIDKALTTLPPRLAMVVEQHYLREDGRTMAQLSEDLMVSRQRVHQLKEDAIALLRANEELTNA